MNKLIFEIKATYHKVKNDIKNKHVSIFKASIVLIGISLIGLSQSFPKILEHDFKAKETQFIIETQENKKLKDITCNTLKNNQAECMYVKYLKTNTYFSLMLASYIIIISMYLGIFLLLVSASGYVALAKEEYKSA